MVFVKKSTFFAYVFFLGNLATKYRFLIFWIEKSASWTGIVKFAKSAKNRKFAKALVDGFFQKSTFFSCVYFWDM